MGFFQSFDKKENMNKKESSSSKLDDMPPPPLPGKESTEIKEAVKEKSVEQEKNEPIPPPPQFKEPKKKLPEAPKMEELKTEEPKAEDFSLNEQIPKEPINPMDVPEPQKPESAPELTKTEKMPDPGKPMPDQMSLPFGDITQPEPTKTQQQSVMVPETLPKMPLFDSQTNAEKSSYTFTQQEHTTTEEIPYFSNVKVEEPQDEFEELFNLPVIDMEEDTESYGRFKYRDLKKPLFIRTDHYSQILTNIDTMKNYVEESSDKISMLNNLKRNADIEHKKYKQVLEDVQRKLIYIDRVLFDS